MKPTTKQSDYCENLKKHIEDFDKTEYNSHKLLFDMNKEYFKICGGYPKEIKLSGRVKVTNY